MLVAAEFPFKQCTGIEVSAEVNDIARKNISAYRNTALKCGVIETKCIDAVNFEFPCVPSVVFFFNPFPCSVMERVAVNLARSFENAPAGSMSSTIIPGVGMRSGACPSLGGSSWRVRTPTISRHTGHPSEQHRVQRT